MKHDRTQIDALRKDRRLLETALTDAGAKITGHTVRCPFHEDTCPSGSIFRGQSGDWLFQCHGCQWNGGKPGDVFAVVMRRDGIGFGQACEALGLGNGQTKHRARPTGSKPARLPDGASPVRCGEPGDTGGSDCPALAAECNRRLLNDSNAIELLQRTRGIDRATAERFGIGITGDGAYWTFPITDSGGVVVAVKHHRVDANGAGPKNFWIPKGTNSDRVYPVHLEPSGPLWLCPGELKAAAVAACGLPALGITCGESCNIPAEALELCRGRSVALSLDDDETGESWGLRARRQLDGAGIEYRIVRLPLNKSTGRKDIADYIVELQGDGKSPEEIAATLLHYWERVDPWFGTSLSHLFTQARIWRPVTVVPTGLQSLDSLLGGGFRTSGVHLLAGKSGQGKSQRAVSIALGAAKAGIATAYFSLELSSVEVTQLIAAQLSGIPRLKLAYSKLASQEAEALRTAIADAGSMSQSLWILDDERWQDGLTRDDLGRLIGNGVERFGWKLVVLDYLGLLVPVEGDRDNYDTELRNSTALKRLARKQDVALLVVAAVRKGTTNRSAETITLDDVLGAGRLGYDAQTVLCVSRKYGDSDTGLITVRPLKMRFAPCDEKRDGLQLRWYPRTGRITRLSGLDGAGDVD